MLTIFNTGSAPSDAIVLVVVSKDAEGAYGYEIAQDVRQAIDISESTLYPVLKRLQKEDCLEVYDMTIDGRSRKHYRLVEKGRVQLDLYQREWITYPQKISQMLKEAKL